jgi:hypothetical protein
MRGCTTDVCVWEGPMSGFSGIRALCVGTIEGSVSASQRRGGYCADNDYETERRPMGTVRPGCPIRRHVQPMRRDAASDWRAGLSMARRGEARARGPTVRLYHSGTAIILLPPP